MNPVQTRRSLPPIMTLGEAARFARVHKDHIHDAAFRGEIPTREVEGRRFVLSADLTDWLDRKGLTLFVGA
jgi:hypothetical protein